MHEMTSKDMLIITVHNDRFNYGIYFLYLHYCTFLLFQLASES